MKLSDWQARFRNASPPLAPEPPPLDAPEARARPVVVIDSGALGDSFDIVLPLTQAAGDLDVREQVLKRLAMAGYKGQDLKVQRDRDVLSGNTSYSYHIEADDDHPATVLVARIESRSAEVDGPCVRIAVPPRRASKMYELMGEVLERFDDHDIIARFLADLRQFSAWPPGCYVKDVTGSIKVHGIMSGEVTTADGRAKERFEIDLTNGLNIKCKAWPFARAELSRFVEEDWRLGR